MSKLFLDADHCDADHCDADHCLNGMTIKEEIKNAALKYATSVNGKPMLDYEMHFFL